MVTLRKQVVIASVRAQKPVSMSHAQLHIVQEPWTHAINVVQTHLPLSSGVENYFFPQPKAYCLSLSLKS